MKIYTLASPSHSVFLKEWFLPSLNGEFSVAIGQMPQHCAGGVYKTVGWTSAMLEKVAFIEAAIAENWGGEFLYSDVDVQFLGALTPTLSSLSSKTDLIFQKDSPSGMLCAGFFVCQANFRTAAFWHHVKNHLEKSPGKGDQDIVNALLRPKRAARLKALLNSLSTTLRPYELPSYDYLPDSFFGGGSVTGRLWGPGDTFPLPSSPLAHHANWTKGIANKVAQLEWVKGKTSRLSNTPNPAVNRSTD